MADDDEESPKKRIDRELIELLNELRVALPGVQVLFAFLLTLPFTSGFDKISATDRRWYFVSVVVAGLLLLAAAMSTTLYLVTDVIYDSSAAGRTAGALGLATALLWFVAPFL